MRAEGNSLVGAIPVSKRLGAPAAAPAEATEAPSPETSKTQCGWNLACPTAHVRSHRSRSRMHLIDIVKIFLYRTQYDRVRR